jgi:hypothetical protein
MQEPMSRTEKNLFKLLFGIVISVGIASLVVDDNMFGWIIGASFIVGFPLAAYLVVNGWMKFLGIGKRAGAEKGSEKGAEKGTGYFSGKDF